MDVVEKALAATRAESAKLDEMKKSLVAKHGKERADVIAQAGRMLVQLRRMVPPPELFTSPAVHNHLANETISLMHQIAGTFLIDFLGGMDKDLSKAVWDKKQAEYGDDIALVVKTAEDAIARVADKVGHEELDKIFTSLKNGGDGTSPPDEGTGPTIH